VAMHSAISNDTIRMSTGLMFRDNTSPSKWEPVARARQQLAQYIWYDPATTMTKAWPYLLQFKFAPPTTPSERSAFARAIPDSINTGVLDSNGNRIDDYMYADIAEFLPRAAAASIIALYKIFGYPTGKIPDPIS
jgi:hypothetical protein